MGRATDERMGCFLRLFPQQLYTNMFIKEHSPALHPNLITPIWGGQQMREGGAICDLVHASSHLAKLYMHRMFTRKHIPALIPNVMNWGE